MPAKMSHARKAKPIPEEAQSSDDEHITEFERKRAARIAENQARLKQLQLKELAVQAFKSAAPQAPSSSAPRKKPASKRPAAAAPETAVPPRRSARVLNQDTEGVAAGSTSHQVLDDEPSRQLLTQEEYLAAQGLSVPEGAIESGSHFRGWVEEGIREAYGLAGNAAEAWEEGGGGTFNFKIKKTDIPKSLKRSGWSDAKAYAHTQLKKNPNVYFFRHVAPHLQQSKGPFTPEEHQLFLDTARQYGCGDKWGLFASHIGTRVGYQCRCYYQQVLIPQGLILDPQFKLTASGEAVWVGRSDEGDEGDGSNPTGPAE